MLRRAATSVLFFSLVFFYRPSILLHTSALSQTKSAATAATVEEKFSTLIVCGNLAGERGRTLNAIRRRASKRAEKSSLGERALARAFFVWVRAREEVGRGEIVSRRLRREQTPASYNKSLRRERAHRPVRRGSGDAQPAGRTAWRTSRRGATNVFRARFAVLWFGAARASSLRKRRDECVCARVCVLAAHFMCVLGGDGGDEMNGQRRTSVRARAAKGKNKPRRRELHSI